MQLSGWWRQAALALAVSAVAVAGGARWLAGPPGVLVHVRWSESVATATRQQLEARFQLRDGEPLDRFTWRYNLVDPSIENVRALIEAPAVADTHHIERSTAAIEQSAIRTRRQQRFAHGDALILAADWFALVAVACAVSLLVLGASGRASSLVAMPRILAQRLRAVRAGAFMNAESPTAAREHPGRPGLWSTVALVACAPFIIILCRTLWHTPFPITEMVAVLEDVAEKPVAQFFDPHRAYYRPFSRVLYSVIWNAGGTVDSRLMAIRLLTIGPAVLLTVLFVQSLRPRTALEGVTAAFAVTVLTGSAGFLENLEIGMSDTMVIMAITIFTWILLNRHGGRWQTLLLAACVVTAVGFKEQGLALVPLVVGAWWTGAPGANRRLVIATAAFTVAYLTVRWIGSGTWAPFEQDVGLGFTEIDKTAAAERFGAFPYWMYLYSSTSTIANVLFAEPSRGIFRTVQAMSEGRIEPWQIIQVGSSLALTSAIAWWGLGCLRAAARHGWTQESRTLVAFVLVLSATGALSFNYSRERLGGVATVFYAITSFFAMRAVVSSAANAPRRRVTVMGVGVMLLATAWQIRSISTLEYARLHSWGNQREWFVRLPQRRLDYAHRPVYIDVMESMLEQGIDPAAPRPTRFPRWAARVIGPRR